MARSEKQKLKLFYLIDIFKKKTDEDHPISVNEIIQQLHNVGISAERKSIYRDIEAMQELGFDIIPVHNKTFSYYLGSREFETAELRLLVDAVQASRFITKKKSNELIKKLEGLAADYDAEKLQSQVFVTNRIKTSNESIFYNVDCIHSAINSNNKISFLYFDWDIKKHKVYRHNGKKYIVSPWALIWNSENYYLIGYDSDTDSIRHYRVDKMVTINSIDEKREGRAKFNNVDVAVYSQRLFGMYNGDIVSVRLRCSKDVTNAVIDRFGTDVRFIPSSDGESFEVTVDVAISPVFFSWVFMFGGKVKIISPLSMQDKMREMTESFLESI